MKYIFTFLLSSLITVFAFAAGTGRVSVAFYGYQDYKVFIDGRSIYSTNNKTYLNDLRNGHHSIEVYRLRRNNKIENRPVYATNFIVRPQYDLNIIVDRNGYVRFDEDRAYNGNNRGYDRNDRNWGNRDDDRNNDYGNGGYGRNTNDNDRNWDRNNGYGNNRDWNNNNNRTISEADFNQLVQRIRNQWMDKINTAREAINNNYFTTYQVRQLIQLFTAENDRLELAKQAYRRTVDPGNYTQLYDLFSSQARNELDQYIRNGRY